MENLGRTLYRKLLTFLPDKVALNIDNLRGYHKFINFKEPKYFGEKLQYIKLYGNLEKYRDYVDKYKVRDYIAQEIGEEYLIPLIAVYDNPKDIQYNILPDKFAIKLNYGSGYNIIVNNKSELDIEKTNSKLNKWLKEDYYKYKREYQYKDIDKKILVENYMVDKNEQLLDYKFYCFNGNIEFVEVDFDRFTNHTMNFYDIDWNLLDIKKGNYDNYKENVKKPDNFNKMVKIAQKLSKEFNFVRVDLYNLDGKIYFGELTYTPASGVTPFKPIEVDVELARKIDIDYEKKKKVLLVARTSDKKGVLDGVTVKACILRDYLSSKDNLAIKAIDVDNWKSNWLSISFQIIKNYFNCEKIVICSSSKGASFFLKFLKLIRNKKEVYFFVSGGNLTTKIKQGTYSLTLYKNLHRIYVESLKMAYDFQKMGLSNVVHLNNFRKVEKYSSKYIKSDKVKCIFYGRVVPEKGIEQAIDVIKKLVNENYKVTLDIYGQVTEDYLSFLKEKFCDEIKYKGIIKPNNKNEYEILSQYDVFLFPTEHVGEGLPGALIDAYISGLAVVASNWEYACEYISDEKNGLVFEYKNYNDFYKKMVRILNEEKIEKYKEKSKELSKNFLVDTVLEEFYKELTE